MRIPFSCDIPILKPAFAFVLLAIVVCPLTTQNSPATQSSGHVTLTYMGTAAWEISDGAGDYRLFVAERMHQRNHIAYKLKLRVILDVRRSVGLTVAAHIRGHCVVTLGG